MISTERPRLRDLFSYEELMAVGNKVRPLFDGVEFNLALNVIGALAVDHLRMVAPSDRAMALEGFIEDLRRVMNLVDTDDPRAHGH